jgi:hypothetical protein
LVRDLYKAEVTDEELAPLYRQVDEDGTGLEYDEFIVLLYSVRRNNTDQNIILLNHKPRRSVVAARALKGATVGIATLRSKGDKRAWAAQESTLYHNITSRAYRERSHLLMYSFVRRQSERSTHTQENEQHRLRHVSSFSSQRFTRCGTQRRGVRDDVPCRVAPFE